MNWDHGRAQWRLVVMNENKTTQCACVFFSVHTLGVHRVNRLELIKLEASPGEGCTRGLTCSTE